MILKIQYTKKIKEPTTILYQKTPVIKIYIKPQKLEIQGTLSKPQS